MGISSRAGAAGRGRAGRRMARTAVAAAALAVALTACSGDAEPTGDRTAPSSPSAEASAESAENAASGEPTADASADASPGPEKVRDSFAGLQATLDGTCTPGAGDCAYFLGRVHEELTGLDASMRADPQGPGHFKEPIGWIAALEKKLGGDTSTENLETHRTALIGTRDRVNTWMQDHPHDYR
ncbi:hypothetical protein [Streptomyces sp. NPDC046887]|uniref:hypothetical protein n=1 Tax=Streptomyces sp. NPDC046887 TaxID=3155472 RepID=UPI0033C0C9B8